jgi:hypothetical protein
VVTALISRCTTVIIWLLWTNCGCWFRLDTNNQVSDRTWQGTTNTAHLSILINGHSAKTVILFTAYYHTFTIGKHFPSHQWAKFRNIWDILSQRKQCQSECLEFGWICDNMEWRIRTIL